MDTRHSGMTLLEMMIVVTILSVLAAGASTARWADQSARLDIAAARIADVVRHARDSAGINGAITGVEVTAAGVVSAHLMDVDVQPPVSFELLRHPTSRQPLSFDVLNDRATRGVQLTSTSPFEFSEISPSGWVMFDGDGVGFWIDGSAVTHVMTSAALPITAAGASRTISVDRYTGRVVVSDP